MDFLCLYIVQEVQKPLSLGDGMKRILSSHSNHMERILGAHSWGQNTQCFWIPVPRDVFKVLGMIFP